MQKKGLNFAGDTGADINKQLGEKLSIKGGASADLTDNNIGVISDGAQLNVKLKKDVNLGPNGSLAINGKTYVNKDGLNAGGQKITNVAPGTDGTDAVNVDQLNAAIGGTSKATTVKAKDANVTVTEGVNAAGGKEYTVGLGDKVTLGSDADKKVVVDGTTGTITAGDKVTINGTTGDIKAGTVKITGAGTVNELTNRTWDIDNPTVVHGQAATEDQLKHVSDGVKNNKTDITNINKTIEKGLNFKGDDTTVINKQLGEQLDIKGGADANKLSDDNIGVVSANGALNVKLSKELKNLTSVTTGNTVMNTDGLTINGDPKIVKDGIDAGNKKITNVAAGTADTDAVNVSQLKQIGGNIKNIDSRVNRVGAGAAALAALHPLDFDPDDKWDIAAGYGNYKDAHAASIGAFYRPNEDTLFSVGGSFGGGENMLNAGVSLKLGQGNHVSTSRVAMAKELKDLRAELESMKGALMKVSEGKQLNSLDLDKMQLFPDVPENHWAYDYVATLAGNGIIVGYPDGKFGGDRMMTRYEMAALIYRAIQNGAVADEQMARALKEFQPELERIRVDTISKHKDGTPDIQRVRVIKGRG